MRPKLLQRFAAFALLFILVAAESLAVAHALDLDAHEGGDPCKICISAAGLGTGVPAKGTPLDLPRTHGPVGVTHELPAPSLRAERASARGPPATS